MIHLHALLAPHDIIPLGVAEGSLMYHVVSDIPGPDGTRELLSTMRRCGAHDFWLQDAGSYREHFDVFGPWTDIVRQQGVSEIASRILGVILAQKQEYQFQSITVPAITSRQMRVIETVAVEQYGLPLSSFFHAASQCTVAWIIQRFPVTHGIHIHLVAGPGKTGLIGLAAAVELGRRGYRVRVYVVSGPTAISPDAQQRIDALIASGVDIVIIAAAEKKHHVNIWNGLGDCDLIVDAVMGCGLHGAPADNCYDAIEAIIGANRPVLAMELPSGLGANEEGVANICIQALATITWALPKRAMMMTANAPYLGEIWLADIGIPRRMLKLVSARVDAAIPVVNLQRLFPQSLVEYDPAFAPHACRLTVDR